MGNISPAGELILGLSQGGGPTETGLSTWQDPTPLLHPSPGVEQWLCMLWGGAGCLPQQEPNHAMQHLEHGEAWAGQGPQCHTCHTGTPGSVALQVLTPQLPRSSHLWVQPCQAPGLLHWLLQCSLKKESTVIPNLFPRCSQCFSLRVSLLHWLQKCTHWQ